MAENLSILDPYRLPTAVAPRRYDVRLRPDLPSASFTGSVTIAVDAATAVDMIVLNAAELTIDNVVVDGVEAAWELDDAHERLVVTPGGGAGTEFAAGAHTLEITFAGVLNDKLRGFYRSTYIDADGVEQVIATTQMQATDCRRAFPCWDEPAFKAVFGITLDVADGLTAISNGPEIERTTITEPASTDSGSTDSGSTGEPGVRHIVRFADTMVMSSYLVAFVVGKLEATEPVDVDGIPLRVVHVPGKSHLTEFGLDVGAACLRWFQDYYGIPYPSDKVDLIGLPDFAAGAMENLGCITFRESLLLVDPRTSTQNEQQLVADVVAHELAHMWFGDLVTMEWWNGIWLNEAFATFMEIAACDAYRPDWERWTSFGQERSVAFDTDSLTSTRSVEFEVRSPEDCEGMFDVLTYQKGGALLRMLEQYLGAEAFREGVSHYLRRHSYANTETEDLWDAIEETSGQPVRRVMDSWIWQPGYPLVSASLEGSTLVLSQRRFAFESAAATSGDGADGNAAGDGNAAIDDGARWAIPVHVRHGAETSVLLLDGDRAELELSDPQAPVVVNAGGVGFYRVSYDDELRGRLDAETLASMSTLERYSLVDDAWSATVAGRMSAPELLDLLAGFSGERAYGVWQAVVVALRGLGRMITDPKALDAFRGRVRAIAGEALEQLGDPADGEDDLTGKLRGTLTGLLGVLGGDDAIVERCRALFAAERAEPGSVDPELLAAATSVVAANGDADTFEQLLDGFRSGTTPQEQLRHLYALAELDDAQLIERTCELAMSGEVKTQNAPFLLRLAIANRDHGAQAWEFVRDRWAEANDRFPSNTIVRMIDSVKLLTDADVVDDVQQFFAEHPIEQSRKTMEQVLERQRVNAAARERNAELLVASLTG